jgi:tRNA 2-selenouridine synthase
MRIDDLMNDWDQFDQIIDVRTPAEFSLDHLPGAINAPVLTNDQRVVVGTLYAQSPFDAKREGAVMVARNIAQAIEEQFHDRPRDWRPLVYCWRGGNRSNAMALVMQKIGWRAEVLEGGYRAYRRSLVQNMDALVSRFRFRVVCGVTGSRKTHFLRELSAQGHQVLDLEALAHHRGSLLGAEPSGSQPSQKLFETRLWERLRQFDDQREVLVESESRKIGAVQVPGVLIEAMRRSPCIELEPDMKSRVSWLCEDYGHFFQQPEILKGQLSKLKEIVGQSKLDEWLMLVDQQAWPQLVERLLVDHYDPTYRRSMQRNYRYYAQAERFNEIPASLASR